MFASLCIGLVLSAMEPIAIDARHQLFLDDYVVESMAGLERRIHPAEKNPANPILAPEDPWEETYTLLYGSVLREEDGYRMWYLTPSAVCYAESSDGIAWRKPRLDEFSWEGAPTNMVVARGKPDGTPPSLPHFYELFGVFKDAREADAARRYKMGYLSLERGYEGPRVDPFHGGQRRGLGVAASADGVHWEGLEPWATEAICDGATHFFYDEAKGRYMLYGRTKHRPEELSRAWAGDPYAQQHWWGRAVAHTESPDFLTWDHRDPATAPVVMEANLDDATGTEIYGMGVFAYEGLYIGLVQRFHNRPGDVFLDIQLAVSRDGVHFERIGDGTPFLPCGGVGEWDRFNNAMSNNPPLVSGDELRFYYSGRSYRHSPYSGPDGGEKWGGIGLASVKRDRFVSLEASFAGGTLTTKPLRWSGGPLCVNAKADFGTIEVEVLDEAGNVIGRSAPLRGDSISLTVHWEEDFTPPSGAVRLRFLLKNALLFSFWSP